VKQRTTRKSDNTENIIVELIKDGKGKTIGQRIDYGGDRIMMTDASGRCKGWYLKSQNRTFNASGVNMGTGDQLVRLLDGR
jgi:hypothetical protein